MRHHVPLTVLTLAATLALTSCAGGDEPATEPTGSAEPATAVAAPEPSPTGTPVPESLACLESGPWSVDPEQAAAQEAESLTMVGSGAAVTYTGEAVLTFTDGTTTSTFTAWRNEFTVRTANGADLAVSSTLDGTTTAPYTATADRISIEAGDASALTVAYSATSDGEPRDPTQNIADITAGQVEPREWAYTCADDVLTLRPVHDGEVVDSWSQVLHRP